MPRPKSTRRRPLARGLDVGHHLRGDGRAHRGGLPRAAALHRVLVDASGGLAVAQDGVACAMADDVLLVDAPGGQSRDLLDGQVVEVRDVAHQPGVDQRGDELLPHQLDVHDRTAHPVEQALGRLGGGSRWRRSGTPPRRPRARRGCRSSDSARASRRARTTRGAATGTGPTTSGITSAGLVHDDRVALAHVLAADLVRCVQRGAGDGGAGHHQPGRTPPPA